MSKIIFIIIGVICMSFLTQNELNTSIFGDFDGNGFQEKAWIKTDFAGQKGDGEREEYIPARRSVLFSNNSFPEINIGNASELFNIGDLNKNQTDEILIAGSHGIEPFDKGYSVYTFDAINNGWHKVLDANSPTGNYGDPKNWVFKNNDTIFYWSSFLPDYSLTLKDTLQWIKK